MNPMRNARLGRIGFRLDVAQEGRCDSLNPIAARNAIGLANIAAWMEERNDNADHVLCVLSKVYLTKPYSSWERQAAQWAAASKKPNFALPVFSAVWCADHSLIAGRGGCQITTCRYSDKADQKTRQTSAIR